MSLQGFTFEIAKVFLLKSFALLFATVLLTTFPVWVAIITKGYVGPMGFTIFSIIAGTIFGATGWGPWFPWSIIPLRSGMAGPQYPIPGSGATLVLIATFVVGFILCWFTLERMDNVQ